MITYMQRNKKYLIVILWVTVISFVGAGFVGWGSYSYGSKASNIAKVGDTEVTIGEFQRSYSNIFSYYNQLLEGKVSEDQKKELQQVAINNLINRALLLNYGKEVGLTATDSEVSKVITESQAFFKDGKFDKQLYISSISRSGMKIAEYEDTVKKDLIVEKVAGLFQVAPTDLEVEVFSAVRNLKDKFLIKVIDSKGMNPKLPESLIKDYYEKNKGELLGEPTFDISFIKVTKANLKITELLAKEHYEKNKTKYIDDNGNLRTFAEAKSDVLEDVAGKITRKEVLKASVAWKKGEMKPTVAKEVPFNNTILPVSVMRELDANPSVKISKPVKINGGHIVYKIDRRNQPKQLTYAQAKKRVEYIVKNQEVSRIVAQLSKNALINLKGQTTKFLGLGDSKGIDKLDEEETTFFISTVFGKKDKEGVINVGSKAVVYRILEQKLFNDIDNDEREIVKNNVEKLKNDTIIEDLIEDLKDKYTIEIYSQP
ncbi:MAG: peptidylprolyl isomerase [Campylobacterales bacterium]|nr:peptidylprolyl isomerase [Campylobacterales bacterium]